MTKSQKGLIALIAVVSWIALIGQYLISVENAKEVMAVTIRYFSYFTIWTTILVALSSTVLVFIPNSAIGKQVNRTSTLTAVTLFILIVGLVYNTVLRFVWEPKGMEMLVDELLHSVVPILVLFFWWRTPKSTCLDWKESMLWLFYPLLYFIYALLHGAVSGFYPYPFINVDVLGIGAVLRNGLIVTLVILLLAVILIAIGRRQYHKK